jgi:hypothetical protein
MEKENFPLIKFLNEQPNDIKKLFVKVLNLHAGRQIDQFGKKEIIGRVRKEIEEISNTKD